MGLFMVSLLMRIFAFQLAQICLVVICQSAFRMPAISRFPALSMVDIDGHIFAGITIQPTVFTSASINKYFM